VVKSRRGVSSLGCLLVLLVGAAAIYFGATIGENYFRFYQYQDSMHQEVRFAAHNSDALIVRHLRERADSLGLPDAAGDVTLVRDGRHITVDAEYYVHLQLPLISKDIRFDPHAEGDF
jgi:hypothetical protein